MSSFNLSEVSNSAETVLIKTEYDAFVLHAYAGDYSCSYDKVVVTEIGELHCNGDPDFVTSNEHISRVLLGEMASDWNLYERQTFKTKLQVVSTIRDECLSTMSKSNLLTFIVGQEDMCWMLCNHCLLNAEDGNWFINVFDSECLGTSIRNIAAKFNNYSAGLTFYKGTCNVAKANVIDSLAHAFLRKSLICVDVGDLKGVMCGKLSVGLCFESLFQDALVAFGDYVSQYEQLIKQTTGVFVCIKFGKHVNFTIDFIDKIIQYLSGMLSSGSKLFFSIDYKRELENEFSCAMVVNV